MHILRDAHWVFVPTRVIDRDTMHYVTNAIQSSEMSSEIHRSHRWFRENFSNLP